MLRAAAVHRGLGPAPQVLLLPGMKHRVLVRCPFDITAGLSTMAPLWRPGGLCTFAWPCKLTVMTLTVVYDISCDAIYLCRSDEGLKRKSATLEAAVQAAIAQAFSENSEPALLLLCEDRLSCSGAAVDITWQSVVVVEL